MVKTRKRWISLITTMAMLAALLLPLATPVMAASYNAALTVPSITTGTGKTLGTLQITSSDDSVASGQSLSVTLLNGVKLATGTVWTVTGTDPATLPNGAYIYIPTAVSGKSNQLSTSDVSVSGGTTTSVNINIGSITTPGNELVAIRVVIKGVAEVDKTGDVKINIFSQNSGFTSGDVTVATCTSGATTTTAISTETVGSGSGKVLGVVRINETTAGALQVSTNSSSTIKLTLPIGFSWNATTPVSGWSATNVTVTNPNTLPAGYVDGRHLYLQVTGLSSTTPGTIQFAPVVDIDSTDAKKGDIILTLGGSNTGVTSESVTIGKYEDFSVSATVETTREVFAGRADQQISDMILEESLAASLLSGRTVKFSLQGDAKWHTLPTCDLQAGDNPFTGTGFLMSSDLKSFEVTVKAGGSTSAAKCKLKNATIDLSPDMEGDVVVKIEGTAGISGELKVATVKKPVTAEAASKPEVRIGVQGQTIGDISITETKAEALKKSCNDRLAISTSAAGYVPPVAWGSSVASTITANSGPDLILEAPNGVTFSNTPTVEVTAGDLQIDTANVRRATNDTQLLIPIKTESSKASTIKVSNIKVTVDRTVPEGDLEFKIKGAPVNATGGTGLGFSATTVSKVKAAICMTPAPTETGLTSGTAGTSTFTIGSTSYTVNGVTKTMDVAPYVKEGRTYIPVRYMAESLGATINWDSATKTATVKKGEKVVKMTIGSKQLTVDGVAQTTDAAPEIKSGRTMLPYRAIAEALGANVSYDSATKAVTVSM